MRRLLWVLIVAIVATASHIDYRLSTLVKPSFYTLKIKPDLDKGTFKGEVSIQITVQDFIESLLLHCDNLTIENVYVDQEKQHEYEMHKEYTLLEIFYNNRSRIPPGNHFVRILYNGSLLDKSLGFFKGQYVDIQEKTLSELAVTDFQPAYARRAFPCFDEPSFKAKFQITVITPNSTYYALSNMREFAKFETEEGFVYKFESTCLISTYLIAFAVTNYPFGELKSNNMTIRAFSLDANNSASFQPLTYAKKAFDFFTEYTNYQNPVSKIDMIEYNRELSGATENWGLITFRKGLLSPHLSIYSDSQIINVISHEIAHYWFGNLITNHWWDDIWLQEGFAVFMALKAEEVIRNTSATISYGNEFLDDIFLQDHNISSPTLVTPLKYHGEIENHFSDITYNKGAAIFRTLENIFGDIKFKQAVRNYVCRYAYKTVTTNDLIKIFENIDKSIDIRGFIESFVYQSNYPIVEITEEVDSYVLKQKNCFNSSSNTKWTIPISYVNSLNRNERALIWFDRDMDVLRIPKGTESWMKLNYQQMGFYRTKYSESLWNKLINNTQDMEPSEREHLLSEAVQLYKADVISCSRAFKIMKKLSIEKSLPLNPSSVLLTHLNDDHLDEYDMDIFNRTVTYVQTLLKDAGSRVGRRARRERIFKSSVNLLTAPHQRLVDCANWIKENIRMTFEETNEVTINNKLKN